MRRTAEASDRQHPGANVRVVERWPQRGRLAEIAPPAKPILSVHSCLRNPGHFRFRTLFWGFSTDRICPLITDPQESSSRRSFLQPLPSGAELLPFGEAEH